MSRITWERQLSDGIFSRGWLVLLVLAALSLVVWDLKFFLGVVLGGIMVNLNFKLLHRGLQAMFAPGGRPKVWKIVFRFYLRLAGLGLVCYFLLKYQLVHPIGLVVGLSLIVLNIVLTGLNLVRQGILKEAA